MRQKRSAKFSPEIWPDYIACNNWNFGWHRRDLDQLKRYWEEGKSCKEIAKAMRRPFRDVMGLIMDQWEKGYLPDREGGIFGEFQGITLSRVDILQIITALETQKRLEICEWYASDIEFTRKRLWNSIRRYHRLVKLFQRLYEAKRGKGHDE
jgi:hypothetical protein